jgi:hypothetical protein
VVLVPGLVQAQAQAKALARAVEQVPHRSQRWPWMRTDSLPVVALVEPPLVLPAVDPTRVELHQAVAMKAQPELVVHPIPKSRLLQLEVRPMLVQLVEVELVEAQLVRHRSELPRLALSVAVALDPRLDLSTVVAVVALDCSRY